MSPVYRTAGTCSTVIFFTVRDGVLEQLAFGGGCTGNLQGLSRLAVGRRVDELIALLGGIICQNGTSCPDQLARALAAHRGDGGGA